MDSAEVAARIEIGHLIATYASAGDKGDFEGFVGTFAPDAVYEPVPGVVCRRPSQIRDFLIGLIETFRAHKEKTGEVIRLRHNITTSHIELLSTSEGQGRTHFLAMSGIGLDHAGYYDDGFIMAEGRWLFSRRKVTIFWFNERSSVPLATGQKA